MIVAVIPAKGHSARVPGKNLRKLGSRPLVAWTISAALESRVDEVYVSTDNEEVADLARSLGARVIDRPAELAVDGVEAAEVISHAMAGVEADTLVALLPTSPFRTGADIDAALELYERTGLAVGSAVERWAFIREAPGVEKRPAPNGAVWVMDRADFERCGYLRCDLPYLMPDEHGLDIDHPHEFAAAEWIAGGTRYAFDLDGTLCHTRGMDYAGAKPIRERVDLVNALRARGNHVTIDTARAAEHYDLTEAQLRDWGLTFDTLRVGQKVAADVYVDDRAIFAGDFR
jgi:CMP-N,N'-diacetyllegionaminic acid synthase